MDWKGYGKEEYTWEPEAHITKGAIKDFYKKNPDALWSVSLIPLAHVLQDEGPKGGGGLSGTLPHLHIFLCFPSLFSL
jgi:hypothetical protein